MHTDSSTVKSGFKLEYLAAKNYGKDTLHLFFLSSSITELEDMY